MFSEQLLRGRRELAVNTLQLVLWGVVDPVVALKVAYNTQMILQGVNDVTSHPLHESLSHFNW